MKSTFLSASLTLATFLIGSNSWGACQIFNSQNQIVTRLSDPHSQLLSKVLNCPTTAQEYSKLLRQEGLNSGAAMVANRGIHNPELGSFSFFEMVTGTLPMGLQISAGEFFFGHFTANSSGTLVLDQRPQSGKLLIELIAWDSAKGMFNFYELIGTNTSGRWFYRGDSKDVLLDNQFLYRDLPSASTPKFGNRLRCSACHTSGGPIMKELSPPHNDWWTTDRPLVFGTLKLSPEVKSLLSNILPAGDFAQGVISGISQLQASSSLQTFKKSLAFQETLRPLFCETEINLESHEVSNDLETGLIQIPSAFFINPIMAQVSISIPMNQYLAQLQKHGMVFPETSRLDADHAWLTPVKGHSDLQAVKALITENIVSHEFALAVLTIDSKNPLFSKVRCDLLKLVPISKLDWQRNFMNNLALASAQKFPGAAQLNEQLNKAQHSPKVLEDEIANLAHTIQANFGTSRAFAQLLAVREAVEMAEISQSPRGQILEPGFRVVFPKPKK